MRKCITAAVMAALLAVYFAAGCSDHNTDNYSEPDEITTTDAVTTAETVITVAEPSTKPEKVIPGDFGTPSEETEKNRPQFVYIMDGGSYVYLSGKNGQNGREDVYILDDRKGHTEELHLPAKSLVLYTDGKSLYYYSSGEGICEYRDGKTKVIIKDSTDGGSTAREREEFFFAKDRIYFTCPTDSGTVIRSADYSGKLSGEEYSLEYKNAHIVGFTEVSGKNSLVCSYRISINEYIRVFGENGAYVDIKSGESPYIVGDKLYYIKDRRLCRNDLSGRSEEYITDMGSISSYCFFGDKLYYSDSAAVYAVDRDGKTKEILSAGGIEWTDFIDGICTAGGRLFVSGGSGAFNHSLAEIDENGKVTEKIHSDK